MYEKGFLLGMVLKVNVICSRSTKNPRHSPDGNRELVTVIECVSAAGEVLYIYRGSVHLMVWHAEVVAKKTATFAWTPKGWTDRELGLEWLERNFKRYTKDM